MKKNLLGQENSPVRKLMLGFLVEESLGIQLKDRAWEQRKTVSELLREYCRAGLRWKTSAKERAAGTTRTMDHPIRNNNEGQTKED